MKYSSMIYTLRIIILIIGIVSFSMTYLFADIGNFRSLFGIKVGASLYSFGEKPTIDYTDSQANNEEKGHFEYLENEVNFQEIQTSLDFYTPLLHLKTILPDPPHLFFSSSKKNDEDKSNSFCFRKIEIDLYTSGIYLDKFFNNKEPLFYLLGQFFRFEKLEFVENRRDYQTKSEPSTGLFYANLSGHFIAEK